jgi:hypothetical protein
LVFIAQAKYTQFSKLGVQLETTEREREKKKEKTFELDK